MSSSNLDNPDVDENGQPRLTVHHDQQNIASQNEDYDQKNESVHSSEVDQSLTVLPTSLTKKEEDRSLLSITSQGKETSEDPSVISYDSQKTAIDDQFGLSQRSSQGNRKQTTSQTSRTAPSNKKDKTPGSPPMIVIYKKPDHSVPQDLSNRSIVCKMPTVIQSIVSTYSLPQNREKSAFGLMNHMNISLTSAGDPMQIRGIDLKSVPWWTSYRFLFAVIWFLGLVCFNSQKLNLSIAIVSMVARGTIKESSPHVQLFVNKSVDECPDPPPPENDGEFDWSKPLQSLLLSATFFGDMVLHIPGGRLSERFGAKKVITIAMIIVSTMNMLSPTLARFNPFALFFSRFVLGMADSVLYPSVQAFWAKWAPPHERSLLIGITHAGGQFGVAIIFPVGGFLCATQQGNGWPNLFYINGISGYLWSILWLALIHDKPNQCPNITLLELRYIEISIGKKISAGPKIIPWVSFFKSKAFWAIIITHSCSQYMSYLLITTMPMYMREVLKFDIKSNGIHSMLPHLLSWPIIIISGITADYLIIKKILSIGWTRKLMTTLGHVGSSVFLIGTGYIHCTEPELAVAMLTLTVCIRGLLYSGYFINHADIAPAFAGTLFGISHTFSIAPGILSPFVMSVLTQEGTQNQWRNVFLTAAIVSLFGALVYLVLGSGEVQEWAVYHGVMKEDSTENMGTPETQTKVEETECEEEEDETEFIKLDIPQE